MDLLGPNTGFQSDWITEDILLCCGEDPEEFLGCLRSVFGDVKVGGRFRGYGCAMCPGFNAIWGGIGTGSLEPLLWEVFSSSNVKRIILVGTAGVLPDKECEIGDTFVITEAYIAGTALDEAHIVQPLRPSWNASRNLPTAPGASIVSTDFYYGFSGPSDRIGYPPIMQRTQRASLQLPGSVHLVDMETGQFYYLCRAFSTGSPVQHIAIKGASNSVLVPLEQCTYSRKVLQAAVVEAIKMFDD